MSYTAPTYVDTKAQAILALASTIADEDKTLLGDGSVNKALDVLADVLAEQDVSVPQTDAGAILALAQYASGLIKPEGTIAITENGEAIDVAQYATADVNVSGGGGDFSTATVAVTLTMPEGKTLSEASVNASVGYYDADGLAIVDGEVEVWLVSGYTTYIGGILGSDADYDPYTLDTSSPITATGGVSWDADNERFIVTGDGTISASLMLD